MLTIQKKDGENLTPGKRWEIEKKARKEWRDWDNPRTANKTQTPTKGSLTLIWKQPQPVTNPNRKQVQFKVIEFL